MAENKILRPLLERFLNKAIDGFLVDPYGTVSKLRETEMFGEAAAHLQENRELLEFLRAKTERTDRKMVAHILLHLFRSLNEPKPVMLHFDFWKKAPLSLKELAALFQKTNLLYACFFLKDAGPSLIRFLSEADSLFFLFFENAGFGEDCFKAICDAENIIPLFPAEDRKLLKEVSRKLDGRLFGVHARLGNGNLPSLVDESFLAALNHLGPACLVYIREEKLIPENRRHYFAFLESCRFRHLPLIDFQRDQKFLWDRLPK